MNNLSTALRNASVNGTITLALAQKIADQFEAQQVNSIELLKAFKRNTGVHYGELVDKHLSELEGTFFNAKAYDMADHNGEQGI